MCQATFFIAQKGAGYHFSQNVIADKNAYFLWDTMSAKWTIDQEPSMNNLRFLLFEN